MPVCDRGLESAPRCPCSGDAGRAINHPPAGKLRASRAGSSHQGSVYGQVMVMEVVMGQATVAVHRLALKDLL